MASHFALHTSKNRIMIGLSKKMIESFQARKALTGNRNGRFLARKALIGNQNGR